MKDPLSVELPLEVWNSVRDLLVKAIPSATVAEMRAGLYLVTNLRDALVESMFQDTEEAPR